MIDASYSLSLVEAHAMQVFPDGAFDEDGTLLLTDWLSHTPIEALSKNFGLPPEAFARVPSQELYIFPSGKCLPKMLVSFSPLTRQCRRADDRCCRSRPLRSNTKPLHLRVLAGQRHCGARRDIQDRGLDEDPIYS